MITIIMELLKSMVLGIPSGILYDAFIKTWEKMSSSSWEQVFLDSFKISVDAMQGELSKYGDGTVEILVEQFRSALSKELFMNVEKVSYSALSSAAIEVQIVHLMEVNQLLIIGGHNLNKDDYSQLVYRVVEHARGVFRQAILNNEVFFRQEVLLEFSDNRLILEQIGSYLRLHHDISMDFTIEIKNLIEHQSNMLDNVLNSVLEIKRYLRIDKSRSELIKDIEKIKNYNLQKSSILTDGLCKGYNFTPKPESYFLAQEFNSDGQDLRQALLQALQEFSVTPIRADDIFDSGLLICKISALIQNTCFGVYQLTKSQNRNIHLELGIALGLGKPFILIKEKHAIVTSILAGLEYYPITSYLRLRYKLGDKMKSFIANLAHYRPIVTTENSDKHTIVIAHGGINEVDFTLNIARVINNFGLSPTIIDDSTDNIEDYFKWENLPPPDRLSITSDNRLNQLVNVINSSVLGIYRIDKKCSPNTFLALGIALGLNRPTILVYKQRASLPSDLFGVSALSFSSFHELGHKIEFLVKKLV